MTGRNTTCVHLSLMGLYAIKINSPKCYIVLLYLKAHKNVVTGLWLQLIHILHKLATSVTVLPIMRVSVEFASSHFKFVNDDVMMEQLNLFITVQ